MERLVTIKINNKIVEVPDNYTIMQAADVAGINIPRLCFLKDISETSSCRICLVEIQGVRGLKNSCTIKVQDNMVVRTDTPRVVNAIKSNLEMLAGNHKFECWKCPREHNCEFLKILRRYNISNTIGEDKWHNKKNYITNISDAIVIDSSKCLLCGRCVNACEKYTGIGVLNFNHRGFDTYVSTALNHDIADSGCIYCGKCIQSCPVSAIKEHDDIGKVIDMLNSNDYVICQVAPAVRAALGEEFGYKIGTNVEGKMYNALHLLGFDDITDVNFAADLTIMEEGNEFLNRLNNNEKLPMFTSCSPGWINYLESYYPKYIDNLSTCKSPQQMQGAIIKHYYSNIIGVDKNRIKVVSIMPCIAKKHEANREEMQTDGIRDVDAVLTTRELAKLISVENINFTELEDYYPQSQLAKYTGAGAIFGATGGVMEAALRTVYKKLTGKEIDSNSLSELRGVKEGIKEASLTINEKTINVCVVHGVKYLPELFKMIENKEKEYHFIEVMACTGGCVNGGGQPVVPAIIQEKIDVRKERAKVLYKIDNESIYKQSHTNPEITKLYEDYLIQPGSPIAHKLLHTSYKPKTNYN